MYLYAIKVVRYPQICVSNTKFPAAKFVLLTNKYLSDVSACTFLLSRLKLYPIAIDQNKPGH